MRIKLVCIGAVREGAISQAIDMYAKRIPHYWPFSIECIPDVRGARDPKTQKAMEGAKILAETAPGDFLMLFDERGREFTSRQWAEFLQRKSVELPKNLVLVIGGPYGFSQDVYDRANALISLSKMTFPHELARLFAVEQLYRAGTILRNEPYHHD